MPEFLELLPPAEALSIFFHHLPSRPVASEEVETAAALGRVTAVPVVAGENIPAFSRSTVDGYAVPARDTYGASDSLPAYLRLVGECPVGRAPAFCLREGEAALIHTGGMLPKGATAVVMLEHSQAARPGEIEVYRSAPEWENVILPGADVQAGQEVLPAGKRLRPAEIGGLMALGLTRARLAQRPRVGILSGGDEVIHPDETPLPGQVRDVNSYTLSALVEQVGGLPVRYGIAPDQVEPFREALQNALNDCEIVVITAGSSASTRDLTAQVIEEMGPPGVLVHGVHVRPGKPTILAVCQGKPVIGLPGNPVSALVIARLFVIPVIERLLGVTSDPLQAQVTALLAINIPSQAGREDWVPVKLSIEKDVYRAEPIFYQSNLIFSLVQADGQVRVPADANGLEAGAQVAVFLMD